VTLKGRVHPLPKGRFQAAQLQRPLCDDELGKTLVMCLPSSDTHGLQITAAKLSLSRLTAGFAVGFRTGCAADV